MDKQLNLKDVQKEISLITNALKAGTGRSGDFLTKSEKAKKRLLEIKKVLQGHLALWQRNLDILRNESSNIGSVNSAQAEFRKAQQNVSGQIDKINKLLNDVDSALDYCRHVKEKSMSVVKTAETDDHDDFGSDTQPKSTSKITSQTIALLDAERYETATIHGIIIEYPKPDLGTPTYQRNCGIAEKIRIGLRSSRSGKGGNYQITKPKCYDDFCGGKV